MADTDGEIAYWVDIIISIPQGSEEQLLTLKKIPEHLSLQIFELVSKHYNSIKDDKFKDEEEKQEYTKDPKYGIDILSSNDLGEGAIKLGEGGEGTVAGTRQTQPYARGRDMEEHHSAYEGVPAANLTILNSYKRDTGSANQTDILPHLFKQMPFFKGIENNLDKTIAVAREGFSQVYFLTRVRERASGSIFRDHANTKFAEELQIKDITVASGEVIEKRIDNANPVQGKFTFRTTYGSPPTASLSQSQATYIAQLDLGQPLYGSDYFLYNTTTGSISSGSILTADVEFKQHGSLITSQVPTTASIFESLQFNKTTTLSYLAKWEQNITSGSTATTTINVEYSQRRYRPSVTNGNLNSLFPTKKTVLKNGTIFIT